METQSHFLKECISLFHVRVEYGMNDVNEEEMLMFVGDENVMNCKKFLNEMWCVRQRLLKAM